MAENQKLKPDDPEQSKRFEETAKTVEADKSGKLFERAFQKAIQHKPVENQVNAQESKETK